ncbi:hypothetical protein D3C81_1874710 [compost metagenome]
MVLHASLEDHGFAVVRCAGELFDHVLADVLSLVRFEDLVGGEDAAKLHAVGEHLGRRLISSHGRAQHLPPVGQG